jgi:hypothetical protein
VAVTGETRARRMKTAENEMLRTPRSARKWVIDDLTSYDLET